MVLFVKFTNANTGAATINFNALGAINIKRLEGSALLAGDIAAGMIAALAFDGTNLQLLNRNLDSYAVTSVTTTATLTAAAFGTLVVATGSSAYAVTLPTVTSNAGKYIKFSIQTTSSAIVTLTPASGTISGQSTVLLGSGDAVTLETDGTNWFVISEYLKPASFRVYLNTTQAVATATTTKVQFNTKLWDTGTFFDVATNYRYLPLLPGRYQINYNIQIATGALAVKVANILEKNGTQISTNVVVPSNGSTATSAPCSDLVTLNGSTDYLETFVRQETGSDRNLEGEVGAINVFMSGHRVSLF
jgi:hypothetical protein